MVIVSKAQTREEIVKCMVEIDDAKQNGWREQDYQNILQKLLMVVQFLNQENN